MITRTLFATCCVAAIASGAFAGPITLDLEGRGLPSSYGFGAHGLMIGSWENGFYGPDRDSEYTNWQWDNVQMEFDTDTGDAVISGSMTRLHNSQPWELIITLTDLEFRNPDGSFKDNGNYTGSATLSDFQNLAAGIDPFTGLDHSTQGFWGFEWKGLSMTLVDVDDNTNISEEGWVGMTLPGDGHTFLSELHFNPNWGLGFDAWYKNADDFGDPSRLYQIGDTKANVSSIIPAPGTAAVMGLTGIIGATTRRRRV